MIDRYFVIKNDHKSLKFLLEQHLTTPLQHTWLVKLLGYDYEISYKKGVENRAANALSRVEGPELLTFTLSSVSSEMLNQIKDRWAQDKDSLDLIATLKLSQGSTRFNWDGSSICHNMALCI